jgi:hypothetical protein
MNTLSRTITSRFFSTAQDYLAFRRQWSTLLNSERKHELTAAHHLLYLALCGKDWRKAFTLARNPRKLANGAYAGWALWRALEKIHYPYYEQDLLAPFAGLITPSLLQQLRELLPQAQPHLYQPDQFIDRHWPFAAYLTAEVEVQA